MTGEIYFPVNKRWGAVFKEVYIYGDNGFLFQNDRPVP